MRSACTIVGYAQTSGFLETATQISDCDGSTAKANAEEIERNSILFSGTQFYVVIWTRWRTLVRWPRHIERCGAYSKDTYYMTAFKQQRCCSRRRKPSISKCGITSLRSQTHSSRGDGNWRPRWGNNPKSVVVEHGKLSRTPKQHRLQWSGEIRV